MLRIASPLFAGIALVLISGPARAGDWTRFRGPNGSAVSAEKLPTTFSEKSNLKWKAKLPGAGTSSPVIVGDQVIVTCYSGYGMGGGGGFGRGGFGRGGGGAPDPAQAKLRRHLVCLDRRTGKITWQKTIKPYLPEDRAGGNLASHGYASHTPVTDGKNIFVFFGKTGMICYDMSGKEIWKKSLGTGSGVNGWGTAASPVLYKNTVIVTALCEGDAIVALDKKTGKEVWKQKVEGYRGCWSTPIIIKAKDKDGKERDELIVNVPYEVWGLNPGTGKLLWYCDGIDQSAIAPSPVHHNGVIYVTGGRRPQSLAVKAGGKGNVTKTHVLWRSRSGSYVTSPVYHDGHVFIISDRGTIYALNAKDGSTASRARVSAGRGRLYASPMIADGKIYFPTGSGVFVFEAKSGVKKLAQNHFTSDKSAFNASPSVAGGELYLRSNSYLYCVAEKK
ncbi:MAG: PQQ-binding-like beta-propeller repeat protein [Planctomycetes bacterium]|nr:PQQ-binding-like beta-propeller repeat protein [Planctomycetota bacterium]